MKKIISFLALFSIFFSAAAEIEEIDDIWDLKCNHRPVVIEAYASWCRPCHIYKPILERLQRENEGKVEFYRVNVENPDAEEFVYRYNIQSVPATVFIWEPNGDCDIKAQVERGLMGYDEVKKYIEETRKKQFRND